MKICCVCGARPNFMKIAAVTRAMQQHDALTPFIVHTGQHYDERMFKIMFEDLELPKPDVDLEVGSASHAVQTAEIMKRFEPVVLEQKPDLVAVVGDVNSTVACALVAVKLSIPVAHVEAGLRSFDRSMPEEVNRLMTDAISDLLLVSEPSGMTNLKHEGVPDRHCFFTGNVMIDTLLRHRERVQRSDVLDQIGLNGHQYGVLTLHRPANVDDPDVLSRLFDALEVIQQDVRVVFPAHPRTQHRLREFGFDKRLEAMPQFHMIEPQGYLDFLKLMSDACVVLTDSGGIQEETTILDVPCITLRDNTERPATIDAGLNQLVGRDPKRICDAFSNVRAGTVAKTATPEKWDGRASERIVEVLLDCAANGVPRR